MPARRGVVTCPLEAYQRYGRSPGDGLHFVQPGTVSKGRVKLIRSPAIAPFRRIGQRVLYRWYDLRDQML